MVWAANLAGKNFHWKIGPRLWIWTLIWEWPEMTKKETKTDHLSHRLVGKLRETSRSNRVNGGNDVLSFHVECVCESRFLVSISRPFFLKSWLLGYKWRFPEPKKNRTWILCMVCTSPPQPVLTTCMKVFCEDYWFWNFLECRIFLQIWWIARVHLSLARPNLAILSSRNVCNSSVRPVSTFY